MTVHRFEQLLASAPTELSYILQVLAPNPLELEGREQLQVLDQVLDCLQPIPDRDLREIFVTAVTSYLGLRKGMVVRRLEDLDKARKQEAGAAAARGERQAVSTPGPSNIYHVLLIRALKEFLVARKITPDAVGGWLREGTEAQVSTSNSKLILSFLLKYREHEDISRNYVEETLEALLEQERILRREAITARLCGRPATEAGKLELRKWLRAVTGGEDESHYVVMAHWLWQIKRLATGQRTQHDMMLILYGTQGRGKSTATELLTAPWRELVTEIKAENLTDERKFVQLATCVIGRWEEMQGANKSDVAALKHTISTPWVTWRWLTTNTHDRVLRTMGFIGTSNEHVDQLIADQTGMRRFYEIPAETIDQAGVNAIDYAVLWQAVSEDDPAPILPQLTEIRAQQAELVHRDAVALWLEAERWGELRIVPDNVAYDSTPNGGPPVITIPAYDPVKGEQFQHMCMRFQVWCGPVGQPKGQITKLGQRLQQEGWTVQRPCRKDGSRERRYFKPVPPTPPPAPGDPAPTPAGPSRLERLESPPSPSEDRFAAATPEQLAAEREVERLEREAIQGESDDDITFTSGSPPT